MFANLKIRNRILLGYSVPIVILVSLSGLALANSFQVSKALKKTEVIQKLILETDASVFGLSESEGALRGYLLTKNPDFAKNVQIGLDSFKEEMKNAQ